MLTAVYNNKSADQTGCRENQTSPSSHVLVGVVRHQSKGDRPPMHYQTRGLMVSPGSADRTPPSSVISWPVPVAFPSHSVPESEPVVYHQQFYDFFTVRTHPVLTLRGESAYAFGVAWAPEPYAEGQ